jgi:hypothetical protein
MLQLHLPRLHLVFSNKSALTANIDFDRNRARMGAAGSVSNAAWRRSSSKSTTWAALEYLQYRESHHATSLRIHHGLPVAEPSRDVLHWCSKG